MYYTCLKHGVLFKGKITVSGCLKIKFPGNCLSLREELTGKEKNVKERIFQFVTFNKYLVEQNLKSRVQGTCNLWRQWKNTFRMAVRKPKDLIGRPKLRIPRGYLNAQERLDACSLRLENNTIKGQAPLNTVMNIAAVLNEISVS